VFMLAGTWRCSPDTGSTLSGMAYMYSPRCMLESA
jgi:hypothetical protein